MRQTLATLRGLQDLDQDIWRLRRELERLPAERKRRGEGLAARKQRLVELEAEIRHHRSVLAEVEEVSKAARVRLRKLEAESANARADQALLAAYGHEMRTLRRDLSDNEEEGLKELEKVESMEKDRAAQAEAIAAEQAEFEAYSAQLEAEEAQVRAKLEKLEAERRGRLGTSLPPDVVALYERLLEARDGVALAALEDRTCQGCFIGVPTNIFVRLSRGREVVTCPNCQRILYLAD